MVFNHHSTNPKRIYKKKKHENVKKCSYEARSSLEFLYMKIARRKYLTAW